MEYVTSTQVKNILAKKGIPRGKKVSQTEPAVNGVVTFEDKDGWVQVIYNNYELAKADGINLKKHNNQMHELIHFILADMNGFEFRYNKYDTHGHFVEYEYFYRKAM